MESSDQCGRIPSELGLDGLEDMVETWVAASAYQKRAGRRRDHKEALLAAVIRQRRGHEHMVA